ncbi:hypothetical protein ACO2Q8_12070 [Larkinella sp. VNQ87]|uniref:hypothetical protein n=1 Tax=Larkinella sp. VNQ87 TaxID=3400921 RepID=UPI003C0A14CE
MKRLLIGASSPVGYFYILERETGKPSPILESPLSYFLLYDEIWFLSRKLCPHNMEGLEYVHFVDEELLPKGLPKDAFNDIQEPNFGSLPWPEWRQIIKNTIGERWNFDNHARSIKFGEISLLPTPGRYINLLVDRYIATEYNMDLAENSANAIWSKQFDSRDLQLKVSEKLLVSKVASLQTIYGPWHPSIEELRSDSLLKAYRRKINSVAIDDIHNIDKRVGELSDEFIKITKKIVMSQFDTSGLYISGLMFLIGLVPVVGNYFGASGVFLEIRDKIKAKKEMGWVGFLGQAHSNLEEDLTIQ